MSDAKTPVLFNRMTAGDRRRMTWAAKRREKEREYYFSEQDRRHRVKMLRESRSHVSLAEGLCSYRAKLGLSRTQFADLLGITRRTLYSYENGTRSITGELLETIIRRGDVDLNEIFSIPPDPRPFSQRKRDAQLAIDLLFACAKAWPDADPTDIRAETILAAANWPRNRRISARSIDTIAKRLMDELSERYWQEEYWANVNSQPND